MGCKTSKHTQKDDEEGNNILDKLRTQSQKNNVKCSCCKQFGHTIDDCNKDPNLKTREKPDEDNKRIIELLNCDKRNFADTAVVTTHMLKKCVRVPKLYKQSEYGEYGISDKQYNEENGR